MAAQAVSQQPAQSIDQIDSADLLIGLLVDLNAEDLACLCDALRTLPGNPRIVVLQNRTASPSPPSQSDPWENRPSLSLIPWAPLSAGTAATPIQDVASAYESLFATGTKLEVEACCMVASHLENANPSWICRLAEPLLSEGFDLVAPCYFHHRFEGLLNSSIVRPLTRSLYAKRVQNPMGPDLGVSRKLFQDVLASDQNFGSGGNGLQLLAALPPRAALGDFRICQSYLGARIYPPVDWTNTSSFLTDILGPIFLAMEKNAAVWQQARGSTPITTLDGVQHAAASKGEAPLETARLINSFQLGLRDLQEIYRLVLPPATLFELQRISPQRFRVPDELWARIVYDFALAHRLRTINRAHLLGSLTPLYLGWVASYALESENGEPSALHRRLERLCIAYEAAKPYLISRWRWPDRFNP